ncbi:MAG: autotransporter-associated beta strand repeat-containing protein [Verrucomicrobia bacterium]|nr:autotransporter-associated beta strand repeat-containing protein [Verrucomicrobiota bacterium]
MVDDGTGNGTLKVSAIHITNPGTDYNSGVVTATFVGGAPTTAAIAEVGVTAANTSGGLVKLGAGILTMTNLNTYTGSTVVSNGTLRLEQTNYSPVITVKSGATLGGNGFLRSVAVEAGGTLAPGASVGTLSLTNLTLAATATSSFEFNGNVANDLVNVGGDLTPGGSTITITNISANPMPRGYYRLINYLGTKNGSFGPVQLLGSSGMTVGLDEVTANQVNLVVSNNLPVPGSTTYTQTSGMSLKISITNLLSHVTDVDAGDTGTLSLVSVSPTTNTVTLTINGDKIEVPVSTVADQFTYTVEDGHGGTNSGTVNISIQLVTGQPATLTVSGGTATGVFYGVPTLQYVVQRSTNLVDWVAISTNTVPASGVFTNIDTFGDLNPPPPPYPSAAYYQLQSH